MKKAVSAFLSVLLGGALLLSFAGCEETGNRNGIDKDDPLTWFEADKETLPSREQCGEIAVGMPLNEVVEKLGKPQRDVGYGALLFQFDVADGSVFTVTFLSDPAAGANVSRYDGLVVAAFAFDPESPEPSLPQETALSELYPWMEELEEGDIVKVRYEEAYIGVAPYYHRRNISYSTDQTDLANAYRLFSSPIYAIPQSEGQMDGGGYVKYDFITAEETYSVMIANRTVWIDGQYYRFDGTLFKLNSPDVECQAFITYIDDDPYEIYTYAEEGVKVGDYRGLGKFEFQAYDGLLENAPRYVLKSAGGVNLLILSADKFLIEGDDNTVIYRITGDEDFSFLF